MQREWLERALRAGIFEPLWVFGGTASQLGELGFKYTEALVDMRGELAARKVRLDRGG